MNKFVYKSDFNYLNDTIEYKTTQLSEAEKPNNRIVYNSGDRIQIKYRKLSENLDCLKLFYNKNELISFESSSNEDLKVEVQFNFDYNNEESGINENYGYFSTAFRHSLHQKSTSDIDINFDFTALINRRLEARDRLNPHICAVATIGRIIKKKKCAKRIFCRFKYFFFTI